MEDKYVDRIQVTAMPVKNCLSDGKPGYKWGDQGHCYTYTPGDESSRKRAKEKAVKQGQAVKANQSKSYTSMISILAQPDVGAIRTAEFAGDDYTVIPVVMLVEGVIHPGNAPSPELALASEFGRFPESWDGRPVVLDHPKINGQPVPANSPAILEQYAFGQLFNTTLDDKKLKSEIWIHNSRVNELGSEFEDTVERLKRGDSVVEVSTGLFSLLEDARGVYDGETYDRIWRDVVPDHLAVLPDGIIGACSVEDGCGAPRLNAAYQKDSQSGLRLNSIHLKDNEACDCEDKTDCQCLKVSKRSLFKAMKERLKDAISFVFRDNELALSDADIRTAIGQALAERIRYFWIVGVYQNNAGSGSFVYEDFEDYKTYAMDFEIKDDGTIILSGEPIHVRPVTQFVPVVVGGIQPATNSDGSTTDEVIAVNKEDIVNALIANAATKFQDGDKEWLLALSEEQLDKLQPAAIEPTTVGGDNDGEEDPVELPVAASQKPVTLDEYIKNAPEEMQEVLKQGLRMQRARRDELVKAILANERNKFSDKQLKAKPLDELENLAALADVADYSAAGAMLQVNASQDDDSAVPAPRLVFANL